MSPAAPPSLLSERLDQMRWIAALAVCAAHLRSITLANYAGGGWAGGAFFFVHGFGHQAVVFFFVISGFLVGGDVLRRCLQLAPPSGPPRSPALPRARPRPSPYPRLRSERARMV